MGVAGDDLPTTQFLMPFFNNFANYQQKFSTPNEVAEPSPAPQTSRLYRVVYEVKLGVV